MPRVTSKNAKLVASGTFACWAATPDCYHHELYNQPRHTFHLRKQHLQIENRPQLTGHGAGVVSTDRFNILSEKTN
jgi:hypothetical protein